MDPFYGLDYGRSILKSNFKNYLVIPVYTRSHFHVLGTLHICVLKYEWTSDLEISFLETSSVLFLTFILLIL